MDKRYGRKSLQSSTPETGPASAAGRPVSADDAAELLAQALESLITVWGRAQEAFGTTVSPTQLRALTIISRSDGVPLHALAQEMGTVPSVASRLCDRLESAGLVHRELDSGNRRKITLRLTAEGDGLMGAIRDRRADDLAVTLAAMSAADREALVTGMLAFQHAAGHEHAHEPAEDGRHPRRGAGSRSTPSSQRSA
ncbi:MarR family winged helix-turn-helix transcriptional regulator [Uniformispora flossi]|uniref:MarR family winged helix-turn-helix transcriptional regulator n=1 Tax=Uniformispora flossi TaxID=3390723 RepID=UPI003C2D7ADA